jgi:hypothetical protein
MLFSSAGMGRRGGGNNVGHMRRRGFMLFSNALVHVHYLLSCK